jgi:hypothetical protein
MIETMDTKGFTGIMDWIIDGMCNALGMQQNIARLDETRAMWQASKQELVALDAAGTDGTSATANLEDRSEKAIQCMCDALKLVVDRIERMRLDKANEQLRGMSAIIRTNGISYLKDKFEIEMSNGTYTLEFTKELMVHTMEMLRQAAAEGNDGGLQMMDARKETIDAANNIGEVYRGIIVAGVIEMIDTFPNWGGKDRSPIAREGTNDERVSFPESFRFDLKRMEAMQRFLRHDVACVVILSQVRLICTHLMTPSIMTPSMMTPSMMTPSMMTPSDNPITNQVGLLVNDFVTNTEAKIACMAKVHATLHHKNVRPDKTSEISILVDEVLAQMPPTYIQPMYIDTTRTLLNRNLNPQHPISKSTSARIKKAWWTWMMEGPNSPTATAYQLGDDGGLPESTDYIKPFIRAHAFYASPFVRQSMVVHEKHYISILNEITGANAQHLGAIPV